MLYYSTLHYATLHYATLRYTTLDYTTLHHTTLLTPHHNYNCNYTCNFNYTTLITLHYNCNSITLRYNDCNYNYNCATPHYIQQLWVRWPLQPLQPLQKTQLQPPFGPCDPCITSTHLSCSVLSLKLPPPPCAVLLVLINDDGEICWEGGKRLEIEHIMRKI